MDRKNDHIIKIIEFEAFPIVSRPNKGVHRVLRSILDKIRPVERTTSKRRLFFWKLNFFLKKKNIYNISEKKNVEPPFISTLPTIRDSRVS